MKLKNTRLLKYRHPRYSTQILSRNTTQTDEGQSDKTGSDQRETGSRERAADTTVSGWLGDTVRIGG